MFDGLSLDGLSSCVCDPRGCIACRRRARLINGNSGSESIIEWLLESGNPSVRYSTLRELLGRPEDDLAVQTVRATIPNSRVVKRIFSRQTPGGGRLFPCWKAHSRDAHSCFYGTICPMQANLKKGESPVNGSPLNALWLLKGLGE
jgi:hypothetical protein